MVVRLALSVLTTATKNTLWKLVEGPHYVSNNLKLTKLSEAFDDVKLHLGLYDWHHTIGAVLVNCVGTIPEDKMRDWK